MNNPLLLKIRVTTNTKHEKIEFADGQVLCKVNAQPIEGKANMAVINLLAATLGIPKTQIIIKFGHNQRNKLVEIYAPLTFEQVQQKIIANSR